MAGKPFVFLLFPLVLISCTAHRTQDGFFTGRRAEIVDLLRQSNQRGLQRDKSIALALRAKTENVQEKDACLDFLIHSHLARFYLDLGDEEGATLYSSMSIDDMTAMMLEPGIIQGFYELWLLSYDAEVPMGTSDSSTIFSLAQLDTLKQELDELREELEPEEAVVLDDFEDWVEDFRTGFLKPDPQTLRRARGRLPAVFEGLEKLAEDSEEIEEMRLAQEMMIQVLTASIAVIERDRRSYEQAARQTAALMNRLFEFEDE